MTDPTRSHWSLLLFTLACTLAALSGLAATPDPVWVLEQPGLRAAQLGLIINEQDPYSLAVGRYYQDQRQIPAANVVRVRFDPGQRVMAPEAFNTLYRQINDRLPATVQGFALAWTLPYRVGCMSITAAFAFGYDPAYCAEGCRPTRISPYAGSASQAPFTDFAVRPAMLLAADTIAGGRALIDRGMAADGAQPQGSAYLLATSDRRRSVREVFYPDILQQLHRKLPVIVLKADVLSNRDDVLFYFTGLRQVEDIGSNRFLPGAIADHLTSTGGVLQGGSQMSVLRWLEAGATGSYGTVVEPCNLLQKFPQPLLVMQNYLLGQTLLESYWKSVVMPGQGLFVGEPLARPFLGYRRERHGDSWRFYSPLLEPGYYQVWASDQPQGPFRRLSATVEVTPWQLYLEVLPPLHHYYRFERLNLPGLPSGS